MVGRHIYRIRLHRAVWDESSLSRFLHTVVPEPLWSDLENAIPLLHRCLVRLGAYPYHNVPTYGPLTADVALVAMGIIHNHEHRGRWSPISWDCDPGDLDQEWATWARRVLFQCMSIAAADAAEEPTARTDADDRDLLGAHETVERWNYTRDWERAPKRISRGEPIIQVRDLPSSRSQITRGTIPQAEFRSLVKLLLCYQLCEAGYEPGLILDQVDRDLSTATDSVLAAFSTSDSEQGPGIGWDAFQAGAITIGVRPIVLIKSYHLLCQLISFFTSQTFSKVHVLRARPILRPPVWTTNEVQCRAVP